jgi:hypothetical protein
MLASGHAAVRDFEVTDERRLDGGTTVTSYARAR